MASRIFGWRELVPIDADFVVQTVRRVPGSNACPDALGLGRSDAVPPFGARRAWKRSRQELSERSLRDGSAWSEPWDSERFFKTSSWSRAFTSTNLDRICSGSGGTSRERAPVATDETRHDERVSGVQRSWRRAPCGSGELRARCVPGMFICGPDGISGLPSRARTAGDGSLGPVPISCGERCTRGGPGGPPFGPLQLFAWAQRMIRSASVGRLRRNPDRSMPASGGTHLTPRPNSDCRSTLPSGTGDDTHAVRQ